MYLTWKVWFDASCDYLCERWKQPDVYGSSIIYHYWLSPFQNLVDLWIYMFWSHYVQSLLVCYKLWEGDCKSETCQCEGYPRQYTRNNHVDKKIKKRKVGTWKNICWKGVTTSQLKTPMKTIFASKVIMFEKTLEIEKIIIFCDGWQRIIIL